MSRLRSERGEFSMTAMLVATTIFIVVLGATLTTYERFSAEANDVTTRNEIQDRARQVSDAIAKALRNLASPTPEQPQAVDKATAYDLVFKTVDSVGPNAGLNSTNVRRVRYCLDDTGTVWQQVQTWTTLTPPVSPPTGSCPDSGWLSSTKLMTKLVNATTGGGVPLFTYDSTVLTDITSIDVQPIIDTKSTGPAATRLQTGVFLRNQNRRPTASFTATKTQQGIVLNGSASYDPEGETLQYVWYDGTTKIGEGVTYTYKVVAGTSHTIRLAVFDPAQLEGDAPSQVVVG